MCIYPGILPRNFYGGGKRSVTRNYVPVTHADSDSEDPGSEDEIADPDYMQADSSSDCE